MAILNSLQKQENSSPEALVRGDEILLQAFTCNAAVNPVIWSGLKPVFVDIKEGTLNIDPEDLERKITPKAKAVLVQHTFGLAADLEKIRKICQKYNLILIEDCAHALSASYKGQKLGSFGRAAFFSFGRDKVISSIYGGVAVTNDRELAQRIEEYKQNLKYPSCFWIFQQLLHPLLNEALIKPLYGFFNLGRWLLLFLQRIRVLSKAVHKQEKQGEKPNYLPRKMPNALTILALNQLQKIEEIVLHQREIAEFYDERLRNLAVLLPAEDLNRIYMRYPILLEEADTDEILEKARKQKIFLNDGWRQTPIVPPDTNLEKMGYQWGSCPMAEKVAKRIINLPTHINLSKEQAEKITEFLEEVIK